MLTLQNDEQNDPDEINFQSYIDAVKDHKIVWDIFVNLMKDLSHKNISKLKQLNEILLNELKISIQEKRRYNQFDDIPLHNIEYDMEIVEHIKQDNENFNENNDENFTENFKFSDENSEYDTENVVENIVDDEADYEEEIENVEQNYEKIAIEHDPENIKHNNAENYEDNFELEYNHYENGESNLPCNNDEIIGNEVRVHKDIKCNSCKKSFSQAEILREHISEVHADHGNHKCDFCGKSFHSKVDLKSHVQISSYPLCVHEGRKNHKCNSCEKSYTQAHNLKLHISKTHGNTGHKCDSCGKIFIQPGSLKTHISIIHEGKKGYKCDICNNSYLKKAYLKKHISKTHECSAKNYNLKAKNEHNCEFCEESFSLPRNLNRHIQSIHKDKVTFIEDFSSPNDVFQILCGQTITPIECIPNGNKTNKKFIIKHENYQNFLNGVNFHHPSDDKLAYEA